MSLQDNLKHIYEYRTNKEDIESMPQIPPSKYTRGTIVILDRTFDIASPLVHDYSYLSLIDEFLQGDPI
jgi:hypothetical protein